MKKIYIKFPLLLFFLCLSFHVLSQVSSSEPDTYGDNSIGKQSIQNNVDFINVSSFPNPASKTLTFTFKGGELSFISIEIYKLTGQPVLTFKPENLEYVLDVTGMEEGIYFYKVLYNGKVIKTEKFVVLKK